MVEGSTGTQSQYGQIVGTTVVSRAHCQITQVTIVLGDEVLDRFTLVINELKDGFC